MLRNRKYLLASLALILATTFWGSSFIVVKNLLITMPPLAFIGSRFLLGGLVGFLCFPKRVLKASQLVWKKSFLIALIYLGGQIMQIVALLYTSAAVCGFITGLYVIITPFLCFFAFRDRLKKTTIFAAFVAFLGMTLLTTAQVSFGVGDLLSLIGAFFYASHIIATAKLAHNEDPLVIGIIQVLLVGVMGTIVAVPFGFAFPTTAIDWIAFIYAGVICAFFALVLQTWGQLYMPAAQASIIMASEPVWAAIFAVIGGEIMTGRMVLGGALVVSAILLVQVGAQMRKRRGRKRNNLV